jgi:hypothetical protein
VVVDVAYGAPRPDRAAVQAQLPGGCTERAADTVELNVAEGVATEIRDGNDTDHGT